MSVIEPQTAPRWQKATRLIALSLLTLAMIPTWTILGSTLAHNQTMLTRTVADSHFVPITGGQPTIVLLVQFSDMANTTAPSKIADSLAGLNSFYAEDSYGLVSFSTTINPSTTPWYSLPHTMEYYSSGTVSADNQLVSDSLEAAYNSGANLHNYKFAIIVHAGVDEAMSHVSTDIHSYTLPGYTFSPTPLNAFQISTSVVSESDPIGVFSHEGGHLLGLPDLYDLTQQIDPVNNFVGYWEIMALGEWNPNNGNPAQPPPGTFPSQHSSWSKTELGWISNSSIRWVYPGNLTTVTVQNLELPTKGIQAVKIPISVNLDGSLSYYLVEMRARLGTYDQYLPFPSDYPGAALLIYKVNDSISTGHGNLKLVDAHPGGDLSDAGFGPCFSPCVSNNTFSDQANFVKIIITNTTSTYYTIVVDRTSSPLLLLQVNTPSPGITVTVDGANSSSDRSNEMRLPVHYGPHEIRVQSEVPVTIGATSIQAGLTDTFAAWNDGNTANPRWISVTADTVITATYRVVVEPSFATVATAALILGVVLLGITFNRARRPNGQPPAIRQKLKISDSQPSEGKNARLFPGDNRFRGDTIGNDEKPDNSQT